MLIHTHMHEHRTVGVQYKLIMCFIFDSFPCSIVPRVESKWRKLPVLVLVLLFSDGQKDNRAIGFSWVQPGLSSLTGQKRHRGICVLPGATC